MRVDRLARGRFGVGDRAARRARREVRRERVGVHVEQRAVGGDADAGNHRHVTEAEREEIRRLLDDEELDDA